MKLIFIGADHEVTGSCHFLQVGDKNILIDYGMEQGVNVFENAPLPVPENDIDYVLVTHAHVDHTGLLPQLVARGFKGQIIATEATADLCSIMLRDCAHIQMQEAEWKNRKAKRSASNPLYEPIYTMEDAEATIKKIVAYRYGERVTICEGLEIRFTDIGHLLGSSSIEIWATEGDITKKIVFSGDIGNFNQPLIKNPTYTKEADYVVMESTYGDRYHEEAPDDDVRLRKMADVIQETFDHGGNVVIPSFAVGRTQEILYFIRRIKEDEMVKGYKNFPVYVDSPLAVEATEIFHRNEAACFDDKAMELVRKGINPITFPGLKLSITSDESKLINMDAEPKVIISASGMCEAGRIRHHLKHNLWRRESTIMFVGYQAVGTLGRILVDGEIKEVKLFGEPIKVEASIEQLAGLSGHADKNGLLKWINEFDKKPQRVFVVHGEDSVADNFTKCLNSEYGHNAYAPYSGTVFNLIDNKFEYEATPIRIERKTTDYGQQTSNAYIKLQAAAARLAEVVKHNEGGTNKDLYKMVDQINALCDKWDR